MIVQPSGVVFVTVGTPSAVVVVVGASGEEEHPEAMPHPKANKTSIRKLIFIRPP
jgi:hypothetical protein